MAGLADELGLNPWLLSPSLDAWLDEDGDPIFRCSRAGAPIVYGPYWPLPSGLYQVELVFPEGQPGGFRARADVATQRGSHVLWSQSRDLGSEGGTLRGAFEVPAGDQQLYEIRAWLEQAGGEVVLSSVRLRRLAPGSFEAQAATWDLAAAEFARSSAAFLRGDVPELLLNAGLSSHDAERVVGEPCELCFRSRRAGEHLVYGPYTRLSPGRYQVSFEVPAPQPGGFVVRADVAAEAGGWVAWTRRESLGPEGGTLQGTFEVGAGDGRLYETRVWLESAGAPVVLSAVRLRRLPAPAGHSGPESTPR
jgi:hypothetical protein